MSRSLFIASTILLASLGTSSSSWAQFLYWTEAGAGRIRRVAVPGGAIEDILQAALEFPAAIALDPGREKIYWTDLADHRVSRANLDGSGVEHLFSTGDPFLPGIAIAAVAAKVYWVNAPNEIRRANLDGTGQELVISGVSVGGGLALDAVEGKLYWSSGYYVGSGEIWRADADGLNGNVETVLNGLEAVRSIALDVAGGKVYWVEIANPLDRVRRANLDGTGEETLFTAIAPNSTLIGIALDLANGKVYWTDTGFGVHKIQRAKLNGLGAEDFLTPSTGVVRPYALAFDDASGLLYFGDAGNQSIRRTPVSVRRLESVVTTPIVDPGPLAIDRYSQKLYFGDVTRKKIYRVNYDGSGLQVVISGAGDRIYPRGIAVDARFDLLYFTTGYSDLGGSSGNIYRAQLDGSGLQSLYQAFDPPAGIAVDAAAGEIYWTEAEGGDVIYQESKVRKADLDASHAETIVDGLPWTSGLTFDAASRQLLWVAGFHFGFGGLSNFLAQSDTFGSGFTYLTSTDRTESWNDVTVDPVGSRIYWTRSSQQGGVISVANRDGSNEQTFLDGLSYPWGIVFDWPPRVVSSEPPHGAIVAREPSKLDGGSVDALRELRFSFDAGVSEITPADFSIAEKGGDGNAPHPTLVMPNDIDSIRLLLSESLEPGTWTTIRHNGSSSEIRIGYLPADVNGDGVSSSLDVLDLVMSLRGVYQRSPLSADTNHSGLAEPTDLLRVIDLLNGADVFDAWNGASLP